MAEAVVVAQVPAELATQLPDVNRDRGAPIGMNYSTRMILQCDPLHG